MARIRTIKPEMWQDEKLSPLPPLVRLVFLGLISMSDDDGRIVDNVKSIDGFLFPESKDSSREAIETLARIGRVLRYRSGSGQKLLQIVNWSKHQKVDKKSKYTLPGPTSEDYTGQRLTDDVARQSRDGVEDIDTSSPSDLRPSTSDLRSTTPILVSADAEHVSKSVDKDFEEIWAIYPKREGGNPKHDALKSYRARRRASVSHQDVLEGVKRYTAYCEAKKWLKTAFVKQAAAFLGPAEHYLESWEVGETPLPPSRMNPADRISDTIAKLAGGGIVS